MANQSITHRAAWVLPVSGPPIVDGEVVVEDGRIAEVRKAGAGPAIEHGNSALLPAFVNAHSHLEYTLFRNLNEEWPFVRWIQRVTAMKRQATEDELAASALLGAWENARAGVGLIGEYSDIPVSAAAIRQAGIRGVVFQEVICLEEGASLALWEERAERQRRDGGDSVEVYLAPHAPYSVAPNVLARFQRGRSAIHCAESIEEEQQLTAGTGAFAEAFGAAGFPVYSPGVGPVRYLQSLGLLHGEMQLVHCVRLDAEDVRVVADAGCGVAHCPKSNMKLGVGIAPLHELLQAGIRVGLGTDSLMSNNRVDMFEEMRAAALANNLRGKPPIPARTLINMATLAGAKTLGRAGGCGSLDPGKRADLCEVSLEGPHFRPLNDIEASLVFCATAADVRNVYVAGEPAHPPANLAQIAALASSAAVRIYANTQAPP